MLSRDVHSAFEQHELGRPPAAISTHDRVIFRGTPLSDTFYATSGGDKWIAGVGGYDEFFGQGGDDVAVIDFSNEDPNAYPTFSVVEDGVGGTECLGAWGNGVAIGHDVSVVKMTGSRQGDLFWVAHSDFGPEIQLNLDGAAGDDRLQVDLYDAYQSYSFVLHGDGSIENAVGSFRSFETFSFELGSGDDVIGGGNGNDRLYGGDGNDTVTYAHASAGVHVSLAIYGGQDTIGAGFDDVGADNLIGSAYNDVLAGNGGDNRIVGGAGDDVLAGGSGRDVVIGGKGSDVFVFASISDFASGTAIDEVRDFSGQGGSRDRLDLSAIADFTFVGPEQFSGSGLPELRAVAVAGGYTVGGDSDGDSIADFQFRVLTNTALTAADFDDDSAAAPAHGALIALPSAHLSLYELIA